LWASEQALFLPTGQPSAALPVLLLRSARERNTTSPGILVSAVNSNTLQLTSRLPMADIGVIRSGVVAGRLEIAITCTSSISPVALRSDSNRA